MKKWKIICGLIGVVAILGLSSPAHSLMIDFQPTTGVTETGFTAVTSHGQTVDDLRFWFSPVNFYNRVPGSSNSGPFTYAELYNDFVYNNVGPLLFHITGLDANTAYDIRFFSSDRFDNLSDIADVVTNTFTPILGTGSPVSVTFDRTVDPTSNLERSVLGIFTSDASGNLKFSITSDVYGQIGPRLNALEIYASVPEPTTLLLLGIGLIGVAGLSRKKFFK